MKKVLLIIGIIVAVLIIAAVLLLGYFGFIPSIAKLMGTDKPRDLGITYTEEDLKSATKKTKAEVKVLKKSTAPEKSLKTAGSERAEFEITSAEFTALTNNYANNWGYYPAQNMQIKINEDGTGECSGLVQVDKIIGFIQATGNKYSEEDIQKALDYLRLSREDSMPFYFKISGRAADNQIKEITPEKLEIGRFPIPSSILDRALPEIISFGNSQIENFAGLNVEDASIEDGKVSFKGEIPSEVEIAPEE